MPQTLNFLQISDLHIGDVDPRSGDATLGTAAAAVVSNLTWFDGLLGHHGLALQQLEQFCTSSGELDEDFELIVTGDFSRCGSATELTTARDYVLSDITLVPPGTSGLYLGSEASVIGVPGNHDKWAGRFHPIGGRPSNYASVFTARSTPWVDRTRRIGRLKLVFAGIDSDKDVGPFDQARLLAKGDFRSELGTLGAKLGPPQTDEVRVLLVHHSWHRSGLTLRMRRRAKAALDQFLDQYRISVILTGHTHGPLLQKFSVGSNGHEVWELRCGTTTQHDVPPYNWSTLLGRFPSRTSWPQNTLIVHRLHAGPGRTTWNAQIYERSKGKFSSLGHPGSATFLV